MSDLKRYNVADLLNNVHEVESDNGEYVRYDDVAPLLAEHDTTPVDAAWLNLQAKTLIVGQHPSYRTYWCFHPCVEVRKLGDEIRLELMIAGNLSVIDNPTRKQVLAALRLFSGQGEASKND